MNHEQILQLLILAVISLVYWWSFRSFPPGQTKDLIESFSQASKRTETKVDDILVEIARLLNESRRKDQERVDGGD